MNRWWRTIAVSWMMIGFGIPAACKRQSPAEKDMITRLVGTWLWKQPQVAQPTVVILELTSKGRYKETTYREIRGQQKRLYVKRSTAEIVPEPEGAAEIAKLKKAGFEPAVESGNYSVSPEKKIQTIVFESDKLTKVEKSQGRGLIEQPVVVQTADKVVIGGRLFERQPR